jgi:hypothetical protein
LIDRSFAISKEDWATGMQKRRITLQDGRYLIFYTFDDEALPSTSSDKETKERRREPADVVPEAEEERRV